MKTLLNQLTGHRAFGSVIVITATLLLPAALQMTAIAAAPLIKPTTSLQHKAVDIGQAASFVVTAVGDDLRCQWRRDGHDLTAETNKLLTLATAAPSDEGDYTVEVRRSTPLGT